VTGNVKKRSNRGVVAGTFYDDTPHFAIRQVRNLFDDRALSRINHDIRTIL
jgi:hypothetical protein